MAKYLNFRNLHLILSIVIVVPAALLYGLFPEEVLPLFFDFTVESNDLKSVFRAIMCLYLGMAIIWTLGLLQPEFWKSATLTNIVFMGGLGLGRVLSLFWDGWPSMVFIIGLFGELTLALLAFYQLKKNIRINNEFE
jgi:Na+-driven multidrug efflux pump